MPQLPVRNGKTHGWGPLSSLEILRGDLILLALGWPWLGVASHC